MAEVVVRRATGHVDGIFENEISGWIHDCAERNPLRVIVATDLDQSKFFGAHVFRDDVVASLGIQGKHGFAIPLELLPPFEKRVFIRNAAGDLLENGVIEPARSIITRADTPRLLVLHIPKTAGTSLRLFLQGNFQRGAFCPVYDDHPECLSASEFENMPAHQRAYFRLVMGHFYSDFQKTIPGNSHFVTFLRQPMDRLRSHICFQLRVGGPLVDTKLGRVPIEQAVNANLLDFADNMQVRMICALRKETVPTLDGYHAELAIQTLIEQFDFVGRVENVADDIEALIDAFGLRAFPFPRENTRPEGVDEECDKVLRAIDWASVGERHFVDQRLYDWVERNAYWLNRRLMHQMKTLRN